MPRGFAGGDDADDLAFRAVAMADDEPFQADAVAEQDEALFVNRVIWVGINLPSSSKKTDLASSKPMPCFLTLALALDSCHSKLRSCIWLV